MPNVYEHAFVAHGATPKTRGRWPYPGAILVCALTLSGASWGETADTFVPSCIPAAPGLNLSDPEFDQDGLLVAWQDNPRLDRDGAVIRHGALNLAPVDPATGVFLLEERLTFTDAQPVRINVVNNGPEWGYSQRGGEVFYSAYAEDDRGARLGRIARDAAGAWRAEFLAASEGKTRPEPSKNREDAAPRVYYSSITGDFDDELEKGTFGWREDTAAPLDTALPPDAGTGRWLPDARRLFRHVTLDAKTDQLAVHDTATATDTLLDAPPTRYIALGAWSAPELDGRAALLASFENPAADGRVDLLVWKEEADGRWTPWTEIASMDMDFPDLDSPEPFVYQGRSYVLLTSRTRISSNLSTESFVWIRSIDPALPAAEQVARVISQEPDRRGVSAKADPEVLILPEGGVVVYYIDKSRHGRQLLVCDGGM